MNATEFVDYNSDTFSGNLSVQSTQRYNNFTDEPTRRYNSSTEEPWSDFTLTRALFDIIIRGACALGIPGNILSVIIWLRRHLANENQSAISKPPPRRSVLTPSVEGASN